jgi:hypothetical protein
VRYRHYKGGIYELVCEARLEVDLAPVIVYRGEDGKVWVRPRDAFFGLVDGPDGTPVPRFAQLDPPLDLMSAPGLP